MRNQRYFNFALKQGKIIACRRSTRIPEALAALGKIYIAVSGERRAEAGQVID